MSYHLLPPLSDAEVASTLRSLSAAGLTASNRALLGKRIDEAPLPRPWVVACVEPSADRDLWWVSVIEYGGVVVTAGVAHPSSYVAAALRRCGVIEPRFRVVDAEPKATNQWLRPDKVTARPDRRRVYFVQPAAGGLVKIGVAADVKSRLATLQTGSPVPLRVLAVLPGGGQAAEAELHERFAHLRSHGEWFEPAPELLAYIRENGVPA